MALEYPTIGVPSIDESGLVHTTGDESVSGIKTFSESPIVPTPTTDFQVSTKEYVDTAIANNSSGSGLTASFTAGENLVSGDFLRFGLNLPGETITQDSGVYVDTRDYVGYDTSHEKIGQSITIVSGGFLSSISLLLSKVGSPTGSLTLKILDAPSGSANVLYTSTNTITENSLVTGNGSTQTFLFSDVIEPGVFYLELSANRANNTLGFSRRHASTTNVYSGGTKYHANSSGVRTSVALDRRMVVTVDNLGESENKVYKANSSKIILSKIIGAAGSSQVADDVFNGVIGGFLGGYTGLVPGEIYYLQDDGSIGLLPGAIEVLVGKAISATAINFNHYDDVVRIYNFGSTYNNSTISGGQITVNHTLGVVPKKITVYGYRVSSSRYSTGVRTQEGGAITTYGGSTLGGIYNGLFYLDTFGSVSSVTGTQLILDVSGATTGTISLLFVFE